MEENCHIIIIFTLKRWKTAGKCRSEARTRGKKPNDTKIETQYPFLNQYAITLGADSRVIVLAATLMQVRSPQGFHISRFKAFPGNGTRKRAGIPGKSRESRHLSPRKSGNYVFSRDFPSREFPGTKPRSPRSGSARCTPLTNLAHSSYLQRSESDVSIS